MLSPSPSAPVGTPPSSIESTPQPRPEKLVRIRTTPAHNIQDSMAQPRLPGPRQLHGPGCRALADLRRLEFPFEIGLHVPRMSRLHSDTRPFAIRLCLRVTDDILRRVGHAGAGGDTRVHEQRSKARMARTRIPSIRPGQRCYATAVRTGEVQ